MSSNALFSYFMTYIMVKIMLDGAKDLATATKNTVTALFRSEKDDEDEKNK